MLRHLFVLRTALLLAAAPALAQERPDAVLVLADDGALDAPAVRAIRYAAARELRKLGIVAADDRRTDGVRPIDASLSALAAEVGARRIFVLRVGGRLGEKIPLSLDELSPATLATVYSASLTAMGLEECDVVAERLVDAVVGRRSIESTAQMGTVTEGESKPFAKKPGERYWFIGLPLALFNARDRAPFGFTIGYGYEAENFRISGVTGGFGRGDAGVVFIMLEAAWIPLQGEISPYVGGGLGYMGTGNAGTGGEIEVGCEFFRLHRVRALVGLQLVVPFYNTQHYDYTTGNYVSDRTTYPAGFARIAF